MCISWRNTKCLSNYFQICLSPFVSIHTGIWLPDNESVKMVILISVIEANIALNWEGMYFMLVHTLEKKLTKK